MPINVHAHAFVHLHGPVILASFPVPKPELSICIS